MGGNVSKSKSHEKLMGMNVKVDKSLSGTIMDDDVLEVSLVAKEMAKRIVNGADLSNSKTIVPTEGDTQQQILACLQRIECILKDAEADRLRAKREAKASVEERMAIYQGKSLDEEQRP